MTSNDHVRQRLKDFLNDGKPGVLAIKGTWGVGKSHLWREFIGDRIARDEYIRGFTGYSYVSLFGATSIADMKRSLYSAKVPLGPPRYQFEAHTSKVSTTLLRWVQVPGDLFRGYGIRGTELWAEVLEDKALKNAVLCIDDLERKDRRVTTSSLLGFITELRDERKCKVILLYNEKQAKKDTSISHNLAEYREKVIDAEVTLQPKVCECFEIVFPDATYRFEGEVRQVPSFLSTTDTRPLLELFERMELNNIRVMQKIRSALEYLRGFVEPTCPKAWRVMVRQTAKLCWFHYQHAARFDVGDVDEKLQMIAYSRKISSDKPPDPEAEKYAPVSAVDYIGEPGDKMIVDYIKTGYVDWEKHAESVRRLEEKLNRQALGSEYRALWDKVWSNFIASDAEVVAAMEKFVAAHHGEMSVSELSQMSSLLEKISPATPTKAILSDKVEKFVTENADRELDDLDLHAIDRELATKIRKMWTSKSPSKPIGEVLESMTQSGGWNPSDLRFLRTYTEDDYHTWLKASSSEKLLSRLKIFFERTGAQPPGPEIARKMKAALYRLVEGSALNKQRLRIGIGLPDDTGPETKADTGEAR
jgi:hypothetical protein